jgi:hypothetical protein
MTTPRPRGASITVMAGQHDDTSDAVRWYSDAKPVTLHTLHALLLAIDVRLARIESHLEKNGHP